VVLQARCQTPLHGRTSDAQNVVQHVHRWTNILPHPNMSRCWALAVPEPNMLPSMFAQSLSAVFLQNSHRQQLFALRVHAFVANRIDYFVGLLAGSPKKTTAKLQRVLNAAARVVSNVCGKYDRELTHFRHHFLHWLDVTDRIRFRLCVRVYKCRESTELAWLLDRLPDRSLPASCQH